MSCSKARIYKENEVHGPSIGYLTESKAEYRQTVWNSIMDNIATPETAKVLMLPSANGEEIRVALSYGIKEENIYACDENAAMLATAKWRKEYPEVNILGSRLTRAIVRLYEKGIKLDIVNLDLCTNLQQWMFDDVLHVIKYLMKDKITIGLTLLKGRETSSEVTLARLLFKDPNGAADRINIVSSYINTYTRAQHVVCLNDEYKSENQVMVYGVFDIISYEKKREVELAPYRKYAKEIRATLDFDDAFCAMDPNGLDKKNWDKDGRHTYKYRKKRWEWDKIMLDQFWENCEKTEEIINEEQHNDPYKKYHNPMNPVRLLRCETKETSEWGRMTNMPRHRLDLEPCK